MLHLRWYNFQMCDKLYCEYILPWEAPYLQYLILYESLKLNDLWLWSHTCSKGPLKGARSADYLITASRTYNIPLPVPLFHSATLICLNEPGLMLSQKCQPTIWTSEGKPDILLLIHLRSRPCVQQILLTNVLWISRTLVWCTGYYIKQKTGHSKVVMIL